MYITNQEYAIPQFFIILLYIKHFLDFNISKLPLTFEGCKGKKIQHALQLAAQVLLF